MLILNIFKILTAFVISSLPFLFVYPKFKCIEMPSGIAYSCQAHTACATQNYTIGSMFVGSPLLHKIFENKGRVKCFIISATLFFVSGIISGVAWNLKILFVTFFVFGSSIMFFLDTQDIYIHETSGERFQHFFKYNSALMWPIGQICASSLNFFLVSWRVTFLAFTSIPAAIIGYFIKTRLFESPVYYMKQGNFTEARNILNYIAMVNSRLNFMFKLEGEKNANELFKRGISYTEISNLDFIRYRSLRSPMLFLSLSHLISFWFYFGSFLALWGYGEDLQENFLMLAVSEVLGCLLADSFIKRLDRVVLFRILLLGLAVASFFGYIIQLPEECFYQDNSCLEEIVLVSLLMVMRFGVKILQSLNDIYRTEALPLQVQSEAIQLLKHFERFGALLVPLLFWLIKAKDSMIIYCIMSCILLFLTLFIIETKNMKIQEQIVETIGKNEPLVHLNEINKPLLMD